VSLHPGLELSRSLGGTALRSLVPGGLPAGASAPRQRAAGEEFSFTHPSSASHSCSFHPAHARVEKVTLLSARNLHHANEPATPSRRIAFGRLRFRFTHPSRRGSLMAPSRQKPNPSALWSSFVPMTACAPACLPSCLPRCALAASGSIVALNVSECRPSLCTFPTSVRFGDTYRIM
jgi:hypothetical protein